MKTLMKKKKRKYIPISPQGADMTGTYAHAHRMKTFAEYLHDVKHHGGYKKVRRVWSHPVEFMKYLDEYLDEQIERNEQRWFDEDIKDLLENLPEVEDE